MSTDLPMTIMFLIFLALFVLLGTSPFLPRILAVVGKLLRRAKALPGGDLGQPDDKKHRAEPWRKNALNDYEIILVRKLAMTGTGGLSRKALIKGLYFKPVSVDRALESLIRKGLVRRKKRSFFGVNFCLSVNGQEYVIEQDLVPRHQLQLQGKGRVSLVR